MYDLDGSTPVFTGDGEGTGGFGVAGGAPSFDFGVDPI